MYNNLMYRSGLGDGFQANKSGCPYLEVQTWIYLKQKQKWFRKKIRKTDAYISDDKSAYTHKCMVILALHKVLETYGNCIIKALNN